MRWLVIRRCMQQDAVRPSNKPMPQSAADRTPDTTPIITCMPFVLHGGKAAVLVESRPRQTPCQEQQEKLSHVKG